MAVRGKHGREVAGRSGDDRAELDVLETKTKNTKARRDTTHRFSETAEDIIHEVNNAANPAKLRELAAWYRDFAERAEGADLRAARIRVAEELEAEAVADERVETEEREYELSVLVKKIKDNAVLSAMNINRLIRNKLAIENKIGTQYYLNNMLEIESFLIIQLAAVLNVRDTTAFARAIHGYADASRETTVHASAEPRPEATHLPSKVEEVFGNIPPAFQTKRHSRSIIPKDVIHDPEVVQTARDIVNANRRTKIDTLEPAARETLRRARRIVRANEGRSPS